MDDDLSGPLGLAVLASDTGTGRIEVELEEKEALQNDSQIGRRRFATQTLASGRRDDEGRVASHTVAIGRRTVRGVAPAGTECTSTVLVAFRGFASAWLWQSLPSSEFATALQTQARGAGRRRVRPSE